VVTVPGGGHGVLYGSECAGDIVDSFLEAPADEPDTSCLDGMERPPFEP
jgi:hypothetical protein